MVEKLPSACRGNGAWIVAHKQWYKSPKQRATRSNLLFQRIATPSFLRPPVICSESSLGEFAIAFISFLMTFNSPSCCLVNQVSWRHTISESLYYNFSKPRRTPVDVNTMLCICHGDSLHNHPLTRQVTVGRSAGAAPLLSPPSHVCTFRPDALVLEDGSIFTSASDVKRLVPVRGLDTLHAHAQPQLGVEVRLQTCVCQVRSEPRREHAS